MNFKPKPTRKKVQATSRSIYMRDDLYAKLSQIAVDNNTSFNNVVISILEEFLQQQEEK